MSGPRARFRVKDLEPCFKTSTITLNTKLQGERFAGRVQTDAKLCTETAFSYLPKSPRTQLMGP